MSTPLRSSPGERSTVPIRTEEVIPSQLGWVPGVEVATVILVVVVQGIVQLPAQLYMYIVQCTHAHVMYTVAHVEKSCLT